MNELGGGSGAPQYRIEGGTSGYGSQSMPSGPGYGGNAEQDLKPWQRGPTGAAAPWQQARQPAYGGADSNTRPWASNNDRQTNYNYGAAAAGAAPWQTNGGSGGYGGYSAAY